MIIKGSKVARRFLEVGRVTSESYQNAPLSSTKKTEKPCSQQLSPSDSPRSRLSGLTQKAPTTGCVGNLKSCRSDPAAARDRVKRKGMLAGQIQLPLPSPPGPAPFAPSLNRTAPVAPQCRGKAPLQIGRGIWRAPRQPPLLPVAEQVSPGIHAEEPGERSHSPAHRGTPSSVLVVPTHTCTPRDAPRRSQAQPRTPCGPEPKQVKFPPRRARAWRGGATAEPAPEVRSRGLRGSRRRLRVLARVFQPSIPCGFSFSRPLHAPRFRF